MEKIDMGLDDIIKMKQKRQAKPKGQRFRSGSVTGSGTGAYGMQSTRLRQQNVNNKFNFRSQYNRVAKNQPTVAMYKNQSKYTSNKSYALQGTRPQLMNTRKMTQGTRQNASDGKLQVTVQNKLNRLRNARQQQVNAQRGVNLGGGVTASEHVARNRGVRKQQQTTGKGSLLTVSIPNPRATQRQGVAAATVAAPKRAPPRKQKQKRLSVQQEVAEIQRSNPHYLYDIGAVRPAASALSLNDRFTATVQRPAGPRATGKKLTQARVVFV